MLIRCLLVLGCVFSMHSATWSAPLDSARISIIQQSSEIQNYAEASKYDSAMYWVNRRLLEHPNFPFAQSFFMSAWSNIERMRGKLDNAVAKGWEAIYYAELDGSPKLKFEMSLNMAGLYMELQRPDSCWYYAEKAQSFVESIDTDFKRFYYAGCYKYFAEVEKQSKNYKAAIGHLEYCVETFDRTRYIDRLPMTLMNLALVKLAENPQAEVRADLERALYLSDSLGVYNYKINLLEQLVDYHSQSGEYALAFGYLSRQVALEDSANVAAQEARITEIQTQYETAQKEEKIRNLKLLSDAQDRENSLLMISVAVVGTALVVALILLIVIYRTRQKIKTQNHELERLSLLNQQIFAVISHDFKGPMIALQSMLEMLEAGILDEVSKDEYTADMKQQIQQTTMMLENLLNWARTELKLQVESDRQTNAAMVLEEVCAQLDKAAAAKKVVIDREIPQDTVVPIPKDILTILLRNLLSNALKFSPVGGKVKITDLTEHGV